MNDMLEMSTTATELKAVKPLRRKILLVDDDPSIRHILNRLLADEDYLVLTAANAAEAVELEKSIEFDLVLLDLNKPIKDGLKTFKQLSTNHPLLPIIVMAARSNQLFSALASGVGALLEKPLDFVKLFRTIRSLLEESAEARRRNT